MLIIYFRNYHYQNEYITLFSVLKTSHMNFRKIISYISPIQPGTLFLFLVILPSYSITQHDGGAGW